MSLIKIKSMNNDFLEPIELSELKNTIGELKDVHQIFVEQIIKEEMSGKNKSKNSTDSSNFKKIIELQKKQIERYDPSTPLSACACGAMV